MDLGLGAIDYQAIADEIEERKEIAQYWIRREQLDYLRDRFERLVEIQKQELAEDDAVFGSIAPPRHDDETKVPIPSFTGVPGETLHRYVLGSSPVFPFVRARDSLHFFSKRTVAAKISYLCFRFE